MSDEAPDTLDAAAGEVDATVAPAGGQPPRTGHTAELARIVEALLFLSSDPLSVRELGDACGVPAEEIGAALAVLGDQYAAGQRGIRLRELAGGYTLASDPVAEEAARRMLGRPRTAALSPAQAETLAIVAYLQPVSRPEITRIRGVSADSAAATLLERGLIEEAGRSQFGAVMYRTGTQFLKLFGLSSLQDLPDVARWDPTPEEQSELRERLLRAGEARSGGTPSLPLQQDQLAARDVGGTGADEDGRIGAEDVEDARDAGDQR
ncbi:MAG TPA: SMC-Scp complex subunit ScpB [Solirubrobacteraceae bacterium]|nr:SMC-Scp complex subunit ScpB [Solirubrobacteraceae bacterium]